MEWSGELRDAASGTRPAGGHSVAGPSCLVRGGAGQPHSPHHLTLLPQGSTTDSQSIHPSTHESTLLLNQCLLALDHCLSSPSSPSSSSSAAPPFYFPHPHHSRPIQALSYLTYVLLHTSLISTHISSHTHIGFIRSSSSRDKDRLTQKAPHLTATCLTSFPSQARTPFSQLHHHP